MFVTTVLQLCHRGVPIVLQGRPNCVTKILHFSGISIVISRSIRAATYSVVKCVLQWCYRIVTVMFKWGCIYIDGIGVS
jgi:hypothetical protein